MRIGDTETDTLHVADGQLYELTQIISEDACIETETIVVDTEQGQVTITAAENTVRIEQ